MQEETVPEPASATPEELEDRMIRLAVRRGLMKPELPRWSVDLTAARVRRALLAEGL